MSVFQLPIETDRMLIRRLVQGDRDGLFAIYGDAENARYNFYRPWTIEQIESHIDAQSQIDVDSPGIAVMLAAFLQDSDELVGCIELTNVSPDDRQSEIGYSFNRSYTGKGLATEAVVGVLGYAFNCLGEHRVCAGVDTRNERSWRLLERVGMRKEAHFIDANLESDGWSDDFVYAMLDYEWNRKYASTT